MQHEQAGFVLNSEKEMHSMKSLYSQIDPFCLIYALISINNRSKDCWTMCKRCPMFTYEQQAETFALWYGMAKGFFQLITFLR